MKYGSALALLSPIVLALAPALYRFQLAGLSALLLIPLAVLLAWVGAIVSIVGIVAGRRRQRPYGRAIAGVLVALAVLSFPVVVLVSARGAAPIHDVTTDTDAPPQFVDVLAIRARKGALNPVEYEGARVAADPSAGRIEATDTTAIFGFRDDVVVRVRAEGNGSRVDVRSLSRVGGGDLGANAGRIREYLRRLAETPAE